MNILAVFIASRTPSHTGDASSRATPSVTDATVEIVMVEHSGDGTVSGKLSSVTGVTSSRNERVDKESGDAAICDGGDGSK